MADINWGRGTVRVRGVGSFSFSISGDKVLALGRISEKEIARPVKASAEALKARIRANSPKRTGNLREGIIVLPKPEQSSTPGKMVYDIAMDAGMNDAFVKMSKSGKRYYYPGSMEYGFRIGRGRRYPGKYYMRDTSVVFAPEHEERVIDAVGEIVEEL